jgi:hypothetical protein
MSWQKPRWVWVLGGLAALLGVLWFVGPRRALVAISRVRFAEPVAAADSFLRAAAQGDTATLRALASDSMASSHILALFRAEPQLLQAYEDSRKLSSAGRVVGRPWVGVDYRVASRVKDSFCYLPGDTDHLQVTLRQSGQSWKVLHAGLEHC